jgi:hypothetical protein
MATPLTHPRQTLLRKAWVIPMLACSRSKIGSEILAVPAPPPHIPRANERTVLQKLSLTGGLTLHQLYPAGRLLIQNMVSKGWIEKQADGRTYCRTAEGERAMKIILKIW